MSAGFWREAGAGALLAAAGAIVHAACAPWLGSVTSLHGVVVLLSGAYLGWLLHTLRARSGRLLCIVAWVACIGLLAAASAPPAAWCALPLLLVWLVRSLYRYPHLHGAALDAMLTALSFAAAIATARHTGSLFLSLWSLFLLQALYVLIPARAAAPVAHGDAFERAHATAEAALRRLAERR